MPGEHRYLDSVSSELKDYFAGKNLEFDVPLAPVGSDVRVARVENLAVDSSETSYSWMAKRLGDENARRAVGRAMGRT